MLKVIVRLNFWCGANFFCLSEKLWFSVHFCPKFADTDQKKAWSSISDNDFLYPFIMTQIFEKNHWFLYKKKIWPIWVKFGQIWPNLASLRLGLVSQCVFLTSGHSPTLGWRQKKFQKFYWMSGWNFSAIVC